MKLLFLWLSLILVVECRFVRDKRGACDIPILGQSYQSCKNEDKGCPIDHVCKNGKEGVCCPTKSLVCKLEFNPGTPCGEKQKRFYYSYRQKKCRNFDYFGCDGNLNNFVTQAACEEYCSEKPIVKQPNTGKTKAG